MKHFCKKMRIKNEKTSIQALCQAVGNPRPIYYFAFGEEQKAEISKDGKIIVPKKFGATPDSNISCLARNDIVALDHMDMKISKTFKELFLPDLFIYYIQILFAIFAGGKKLFVYILFIISVYYFKLS